ncbi:MAG: amino acid adenylation domain-containing protein [Corynebacterium sp.]|nr:amino acid adenylation domain-containing protein [Corynebacterium sp.]
MTSLPLTPAQIDLWHAHRIAIDPSHLQCAELLTFSDVDLDLLVTTLASCIAQVPNFSLEYREDNAHVSAFPVDLDPNTLITVNPRQDIDFSATELHELVAITPTEQSTLTVRDLQQHTFFYTSTGEVAWIARFHHLIGDGFSIQTFLHWVTRCYTAALNPDAKQPEFPFNARTCAELLRVRQEAVATVSEASAELPTTRPAQNPLADEAQPASILEAFGITDLGLEGFDDQRSDSQGVSKVRPQVMRAQGLIPADKRAILRALAKTHGVTELELATAVLASYTASVCQTSVLSLGMPLMNRPFGARTIACDSQVNVLPLYLRGLPEQLGGNIDEVDTAGLCAQVAAQLKQVRAYSKLPVAQLRELYGVSDPSQPLTGVMVNYRPFMPTFRLGSSVVEFQTLSTGPMQDLEWIIQTGPAGALEVLAFARIQPQYAAVLEKIVAQVVRFFGAVATTGSLVRAEYLSPEDEKAINACNATAHSGSWDTATVPQLCATTRARALENPTPHAFWHHSGILDSAKLWAQIDKAGAALRAAGIAPGMVVAIQLPRIPAQLYIIAACASAGIPWVPFDPNLPPARLQSMAETARPALVVVQDDAPLFDLPRLVVRGEDIHPEYLPPAPQNTDGITTTTGGVANSAATIAVGLDDPAYYLFTSGSTGAPKCVAVPQRGIVNRLEWMVDYCAFGSADRIMVKTPYSFDVSVWEYLLGVTHNIPIALAAPQAHRDFALLQAELQASQATICHFVPSALQVFMATQTQQPSTLRLLITSGEALEVQVAQRAQSFFAAEVYNLYGPTEASIDVTAYRVSGQESQIPIGAPVWNTQCYVVDTLLRRLPIGVAGHLLLGGVQLATGYVGRPELTTARFLDNPWDPGRLYHTGDIASWDYDGQLYYQGRSDFQLKLRGQRIELPEIEAVLSQAPQVSQFAVIVREVAGNPMLLGYVVSSDGQCNEQEVHDFLATRLPEYMLPSALLYLDTLPTTANGKLDRKALPDPDIAPDDGPANHIESRIQALFQEVLETSGPLGRKVSFFELGGNSLSAMLLVAALQRTFPDTTWDLPTVFAQPTIAALGALVTNEAVVDSGSAAYEQWLPLRPNGDAAPVICFYPAGGLGWTYAQLLAKIPPQHPVYALQAPGFDGHIFAPSISAAAFMAWEQIQKRCHGPEVIFIGWSVGGMIAQEAAAQGHPDIEVTSLHLFDAYPAECWHNAPKPNEADIFQGVLNMAGMADVALPQSWEELTEALHASESLFAQLPTAQLQQVVALMLHHAQLMHEHETAVATVPAVHYAATKNGNDMDPAAWQPFVGSFYQHAYPVDHPSILRAVECLAL